MTVTAAVVATVLDTEMLQMTALRRTIDYERATYLAGAGVNEALMNLESNPSWRTGISSTELPTGSGNTYSATAVDVAGGNVVVTGTGVAGSVTRRLQVTVQAQ